MSIRTRVERELDHMRRKTEGPLTDAEPSSTGDFGDRASDASQKHLAASQRRLIEAQAKVLQRVLKKDSEGTYGVCDVGIEKPETRHLIPADRLEANPAVIYCLPHQKETERQSTWHH